MAYREFEDREGIAWRAWDTHPAPDANVRADMARGWIAFESEAGLRRLSPVPAGWEDAGEGELREWLDQAAPHATRGTDLEEEDGEPEPVASHAAVGEAEEAKSDEGEDDGPEERTRSVIQRAQGVIRSVEEALRRYRRTLA